MLQNHDRANRFGLKQVETTIKDGRFTEKLQLPVNPLTGEEAEAVVGRMMQAPPAVIAKAKSIYE